MRPSGTHLYKRICPSVRPSVRRSVYPLRKCKNRVSRLFLATVRSYTETNDQPTCFDSLLYHLVVSPVCSSICLSIYVTWSIHADTVRTHRCPVGRVIFYKMKCTRHVLIFRKARRFNIILSLMRWYTSFRFEQSLERVSASEYHKMTMDTIDEGQTDCLC